LRAWTLVKYGCKLFNERLGREVFRARSFEFKAEIEQAEVKELVNEAVDKVVELA
jgi:hypothetical protein